MRPLDRVLRTRRALGAAIAVQAGLWAVAAALAVVAAATVGSRRLGGDDGVLLWIVASIVAAVVLVMNLAAGRRLTVPRVALWIEERVPTLQYALVTAVDPTHAGSPVLRELEEHVARMSWGAETRRAVGRGLLRPGIALLVASVALLAARRVEVAAATPTGARVVSTTSGSRGVPAPFARLTATVRPPAYTGAAAVTIRSPVSIASLVGSAITLAAPGAREEITATADGRALVVEGGGGQWRVALTMGERPSVIRLRHSLGERLVALEPRADSAPVVRLTLPARDTVLRAAEGQVALAADARDDIGLVRGAFEYIVSSGEGESFQFRSGTLGPRQFRRAGQTSGTLEATLGLAALALKPGDVVHLRAVARDANDISGPGVGASETRVVRIARASEYDSVAVEGAPPPEADKSLISQRMLIILTEALERRRPRLSRETRLSESRVIARDQTRLRRRVGDIIFARLGDDPTGEHAHGPGEEPHDEPAPSADTAARDSARRAAARAGRSAQAIAAADSADSARAALLRAAEAATTGGAEILDSEGDETPIVAINRPLLEAYNAMWEASRELDQGETARALPPMRRALAAIQRARQAERVYLRGRAPAVVVDLARVRLTGKERGGPSTRNARPPADPAAARRAERLAAAITLATHQPAAAVDSLVLLRVESLDEAPTLAAALSEAIDVLRGGGDATASLAKARRVAAGTVRSRNGLRPWSGVW